jgi:KDO2-lipid IV(A) lauroyltransferase
LKDILKEIKQAFEFLIFISLLKIVSVFTFNQTSKIGSFLVGFFGRYSRYQRIISSNLNFLNFDQKLKEQLIINNLQQMGRVFFEFLNLDKFNWKNLEVKNNFNFEKIMNYEGPRIFISAHIGNWEITRNHLLNQGFTLHSVYRQANNSKIDKFIQIKRYKKNAFFYKKGSESAKNMIKALKNKEDLALLVDQRDSSGPLINFFGSKAYTTDGFANLALKYKTMICPVYTIRNVDNSFQFIYDNPMLYEEFKECNPQMLTQKIYSEYYEKWISNHPEQWLWAHERWRT